MDGLDAVVVGAGPNGLAAAVTLARAGRSVHLIEAAETIGGGLRSAELTLPGFVHDTCSSVHPLAIAGGFLPTLPLEEHGLRWIFPPVEAAHPLDDGSAALLCRSFDDTGATLGADAAAWRSAFAALSSRAQQLLPELLQPVIHVPRHPLLLARFGLPGLASARWMTSRRFREPPARALFAGLAAHAIVPLEATLTASVGMLFAILGHSSGWPFPAGGAQSLANALGAVLRASGGTIQTGLPIRSLTGLPPSRVVLFDLTPRQVLQIVGDALPASYRRRLERFRYGPAVFKIDWALREAIPWRAAGCRRSATVHVGGTFDEIAHSEREACAGRVCERPFLIVTQPSLFDPTRAPQGRHTAWAYCHVPNGWTGDATDLIEAQMERFAPGFRDVVLARHSWSPAQFEAHDANYVGGDIAGGATTFPQMLFRPVFSATPYATPNPRLFLCSASTPPGAGVHGLCGHLAARAALARSLA